MEIGRVGGDTSFDSVSFPDFAGRFAAFASMTMAAIAGPLRRVLQLHPMAALRYE